MLIKVIALITIIISHNDEDPNHNHGDDEIIIIIIICILTSDIYCFASVVALCLPLVVVLLAVATRISPSSSILIIYRHCREGNANLDKTGLFLKTDYGTLEYSPNQ